MKLLADATSLSFDCYGTLIDWEAGIADVLCRWATEQGLDIDAEELLLTHASRESQAQADSPAARYPQILEDAFRGVGDDLGSPVSDTWARRLATSVPDWPAFTDSQESLSRLAGHCPLVIVSNVHRAGFQASNEQLRGRFSAVITAEDVGAYKPAAPHFDALDATLEAQGLAPETHLHVAQSLFHDHVPARRHGLTSVWIDRRHDRPGWGATPEPEGEWDYAARFRSMAELADAMDRARA